MALKDDQSALLERIRYALEAIERVPDAYRNHTAWHREIDKDHDRIDTRPCIASDVLVCRDPDSDLCAGRGLRG
ncbi:hypothetical protein [Burkholderia stagnalis]|uniref:hypothetical protein n=1 Tax=Burkholderia stagnalis TaxID=1503054 RepID=UPI0012DA357A|nr:hypothetical protein [Burkholderia stagnalis]